MTRNEEVELVHAVKRSWWSASIGMLMFLRKHSHLNPTPEMYALAVGVGRTPFPNIVGLPEGPFPVYKDRPFYDARLRESASQKEWDAEIAELG